MTRYSTGPPLEVEQLGTPALVPAIGPSVAFTGPGAFVAGWMVDPGVQPVPAFMRVTRNGLNLSTFGAAINPADPVPPEAFHALGTGAGNVAFSTQDWGLYRWTHPTFGGGSIINDVHSDPTIDRLDFTVLEAGIALLGYHGTDDDILRLWVIPIDPADLYEADLTIAMPVTPVRVVAVDDRHATLVTVEAGNLTGRRLTWDGAGSLTADAPVTVASGTPQRYELASPGDGRTVLFVQDVAATVWRALLLDEGLAITGESTSPGTSYAADEWRVGAWAAGDRAGLAAPWETGSVAVDQVGIGGALPVWSGRATKTLGAGTIRGVSAALDTDGTVVVMAAMDTAGTVTQHLFAAGLAARILRQRQRDDGLQSGSVAVPRTARNTASSRQASLRRGVRNTYQ